MLVAAFGYASVGHGGASAYLAALALAGVAPSQMRPIALVLNILVSAIGTYKFWRAGYFRWRLFWPFAAVSIPARRLLPLAAVLAFRRRLYPARLSGRRHYPSRARVQSPGGRGADLCRLAALAQRTRRHGDARGARSAIGLGNAGRCRPWPARRTDRGRRWHLPEPAPPPPWLGRHQADLRRGGAVYPRQFDRRYRGRLHRQGRHAARA